MSQHPLVINFPDQFFFPHLKGRPIHPRYRRSMVDEMLVRTGLRKQRPFAPWIDALRQGRRVVILDTALDADMLDRLQPWREQLIIFLWNPVGPPHQFIVDQRQTLKVYSHDRGDCARHGFAFNTTFYHRIEGLTPHPQQRDVVFIGTLKGRLGAIEQLHDQLQSLDCLFYLRARSADRAALRTSSLPLQRKPMPYATYLRHVLASRAILEVLQPGQDSLTVRVMESLFYGRKLITTYARIVDEPFYDPRNIHVIHDVERVDMPALRAFLDEPYREVDPAIVASYHYDAWINRFD